MWQIFHIFYSSTLWNPNVPLIKLSWDQASWLNSITKCHWDVCLFNLKASTLSRVFLLLKILNDVQICKHLLNFLAPLETQKWNLFESLFQATFCSMYEAYMPLLAIVAVIMKWSGYRKFPFFMLITSFANIIY